MSVQAVDGLWLASGPLGQAGRMLTLDLPNRAGALRGALVEVEVSCTWCRSVQLFPLDRAAGQCLGDSTPSAVHEQSQICQGPSGSSAVPVTCFQAPSWEETGHWEPWVCLLALGVPGACPSWVGFRLLVSDFPAACPRFFSAHS